MISRKIRKRYFKRSVWVMLTIFFTTFFTVVTVGGNIANNSRSAIDSMFNIEPYKKINDENSNEDTEYFKSDYVKSDGSYDHQKMRKNSQEVATQVGVEGSVLLWNDNNALPLSKNTKVNLLGISSVNYAYLGDGSGAMSVSSPNNMLTALTEAGLDVNTDLYFEYAKLSPSHKRDSRKLTNEVRYNEISNVIDKTINIYNDVAIMTISRVAGEHYDIMDTNSESFIDERNYLSLSTIESDVLLQLKNLKKDNKIKRIVLLINSANALQFKGIKENYDIDACVLVGLGGAMSFTQIGQILTNTGDTVLSGHLTDTLVYDHDSTPSKQNFGDLQWNKMSDDLPDLDNQGKQVYATFNTKYVVYQEGVYVGYRYYETRYEDTVLNNGNASSNKGATSGDKWSYVEEVAFPFGYGLSYTDFAYSNYNVKDNGTYYTVSLDIKNIGTKYAGKDVLQVYLQKPYTEYDKTNGIEKPSCELVGFTKTKLLQPNESQTLSVDVKKEDLKTYDAYGKQTYILEKGDYYLSIGKNAHDALNNILAYKGKTTADGMDYDGDKSFVHYIEIKNDDFVTYSVSSVTNNKITNQFNDADINLYEGTKDQKITYLSRNNWDATYPTVAIKLNCINEQMVYDMQYGHEVKANPEDQMPLYNTVTAAEGELTLAMLMELDYDDPKWQDLLNQMSKGEQEYLISFGLHFIAGAKSVSAPGCKSKDGPAGIKVNNPEIGTQMAFPSGVVVGQTWNLELVEKFANAFSLEILHAGYNAIYAPGGCIHRSAYGGRNWEYFSEDGFISGKMLASEVKSLQKRGCIVFTKHFALNDQETNRYGIATWANEQSIREIYLKPFEIAVVEANMNGVMSSFNRIGCTWAGAHKGLLTEVLRKEWNFVGIVETDSCTGTTDSVHHMTNVNAKSAGLLAGNDLWMDKGGTETYLIEHENNPTVMLALREACHRILYTQLHSNAMNGVSTSTRIVKITSWWQTAILVVQYSSLAVLIACLTMAILSFVFNSKKFINYQKNKLVLSQSNPESNNPNENPQPNKKIWLILIAILLLIGIIAAIVIPLSLNSDNTSSSSSSSSESPSTSEVIEKCQHECPICGLCIDLESKEEYCSEKCGHDKTTYEFEAEDGELIGGKKGNLKVSSSANGVTYVGELNQNLGATLKYNFTVSEDTIASLVITLNKRVAETIFDELIYVYINNNKISPKAIVHSNGQEKETWEVFSDVCLGCINLQKGNNEIVFRVMKDDQVSGYNIDKIKLLSDKEITKTPICLYKCTTCGKCLLDNCDICQEKCEVQGGTHYKFEAENAELKGGVKGNLKIEGSESKVVGALSENKDASVTFNINSNSDTIACLIGAVTRRDSQKVFTEGLKVTVNGEEIISPSIVEASPTGKNDWFNSVEVKLGCISLKEGNNTIIFTVRSTSSQTCFNFDYIVIESTSNLEMI